MFRESRKAVGFGFTITLTCIKLLAMKEKVSILCK